MRGDQKEHAPILEEILPWVSEEVNYGYIVVVWENVLCWKFEVKNNLL